MKGKKTRLLTSLSLFCTLHSAFCILLALHFCGEASADTGFLVRQLVDPSPEKRKHAQKTLIDMGVAALPDLTDALDHTDEEIRIGVVHLLGEMGRAAMPQLQKALQDGSEPVRLAAIQSLGVIEVPPTQVVPILMVSLLRDPSAQVRGQAAATVGEMGIEARDAVPALIVALNDPHEMARLAAVEALGYMEDAAQEAIPALKNQLDGDNQTVCQAVIRTLGLIGEPTETIVPLLVGALADKREQVRWEAAMSMREIGAPAIPYVIAAMSSPQRSVRFYATLALGEIGLPTPESTAVLTQALADADTRAIAARALGRIGKGAAESVPQLIAVLADENFLVREAVAEALGQMGEAGAPAVPALIDRLQDENLGVRQQTCVALGRMGSFAAAAVPYLVVAVLTDETIRRQAITALGAIGPAAHIAAPSLIQTLHSNAPEDVRESAVVALWRVQADWRVAVPALVKKLHTDASTRVRAVTAGVLSKYPAPLEEVIPPLILAYQDKNTVVTTAVHEALESMGLPVVPFVLEALENEDSRIRDHAASLLSRLAQMDASVGSKAVITALVKASTDRDAPYHTDLVNALKRMGTPATSFLIASLAATDASVRQHAAYLLGQMDTSSDLVIAALEKALTDPQPLVSAAAEAALRRIGGPKPILFKLATPFRTELDNNTLSDELHLLFEKNGITLVDEAQVVTEEKGKRWRVIGVHEPYIVWEEDENLYVSTVANRTLMDYDIAKAKKRRLMKIED